MAAERPVVTYTLIVAQTTMVAKAPVVTYTLIVTHTTMVADTSCNTYADCSTDDDGSRHQL